MADWWEKYKKDRNLGGNKKSSSKRTWLKKEVSVTDENRQTAKSSTWWEDYKKTRDLDSKVAANRQRAERSQRFGSANRQLEQNRNRDAAEDEIRELFRNPFSTDAEWQAGVLQRNAERYKRDLPLYQQALQNASTWGEYFSTHRQAGESQSAVKHQFERYQQAAQQAEQDRNESNLINRPAQWQAENLSPQEIERRLAYYRSEAATPTVTDKDREARAYLYPEAALQKDPHGARFDERLVEDEGQDAVDAAYKPILTEQEKAAVEEADQQIIKEKAERNYEQVQRLLAAQKGQTEMFTRARGNQLMEEIATGGAAAKQVEDGRAAFEAKQQQIASETSFEIGDDLDSNRGAYNKMQKERRERGYILGYDWDNVPEDRKQAVYALYAQDPEKAMELAKYYIADARQAEDEERQAWYAQSGWTAALGLVSSAAAHLGAAVDPFGDVGQELTRRGDNALAGGSQWADAATGYQKIPEWVPIVGGKGAGDFYQTVGSVVQSAAVAAPAILAGRYDQAGAEVLSKLGLALMGSSAAASDYRESVAAGMDEDRAKLHALAAGVEEALFEEVSLDKLIKMDTSGGLKAALKNWLVQSGIEGSEELATSIANRFTDEMISGAGQSKVERRASELIANGMNSTEAHTQAENEWMTDTLYEGFSGFLSGGMMTGGNYALQGLANLKERAVNAVETRKAQRQAGAAVSRSEGSVEALQAYAKDNGIEIKTVETAEQNAEESAEQGSQEAKQNSYSSRDYRSISDTNSKVTQSIRNDLRGKTVQEQQAVRDSLVEKYGEGIAPVVNNAISIETAARVRQEYGNVDSIQAARNQAVSEIKDESLRRAVSDGYDSAAYSLAASQGGEGGMDTMSRYIQQRRNTGSGSEMSMNATVTAQDGSTKSIAITGMSEDGKRVSLADGSEVAVKDLQADADTTSAIQQLADLDLGADATKVLQAYQQSGVAGTEGYRWLMDYATAYNQGRTRQISLEQAAQRSSLDERTVMDAYTLGQQAANRETQAGLEKLKNLPKRKGANGRAANIDTTEIKGKTMSKSEMEQFELANQYAQALGVDMVWFSSREQGGKFVDKNGAYENGKIYMDIHAGRNFTADLTSGILATMGHELTHFQQQYAPEEYQALKEFLFEQIVKSSPNGEARLERLIWEKQRRSGYTLSRKAAEDEVVADACQKMLRDSKVVHDFASQQPEAANGVVRWLDKWFKRVRSIFGRGGNYSEEAQLMDSLEQDVKAAFGELWDKALKQAVQVHDEVGNIEKPATEGESKEESEVQNSDRDIEYLELAKDPEKNAAKLQEMVDEAAKDAGARTFKNGKVRHYYHGTTKAFTSFAYEKARRGNQGFGFYFAAMPHFAERYGNTIDAYILTDNLATSDDRNVTPDQVMQIVDKYGLDIDVGMGISGDVKAWIDDYKAGRYDEEHNVRGDVGILKDLQQFINEQTSAKAEDILKDFQSVFGYDGLQVGWETVLWDNGMMKKADPVTYDDQGNVIPLSQRFNTENQDIRYSQREQYEEAVEASDVLTRYSLREAPAPQKTIKAYKAFYVKDGKLYPPMVSNNTNEEDKQTVKKASSGTMKGLETPVGVWLDADVGGIAVDENGVPLRTKTTGRLQVQNDKGGGTLAFRPGWHLGEWPDASQFNVKDPVTGALKSVMPDNLVFAECEIAADVDYQLEAYEYGISDKGGFSRTQAGLPRVPTNGYYKYRTNVDPTTAPWYITGAMKVTRILSDEERRQICNQFGVTPQERASHKDIDLEAYGLKAGPVKQTENLERFRKNKASYDNDALLKAALEDENYSNAYVRRTLDFDNETLVKEFELDRISPDQVKKYRESYQSPEVMRSERDELASDNQIHDLTNRSGDVVGIQNGNGHAVYSERTYENGGREAMESYLRKQVDEKHIDQTEMDQILASVDEIYKYSTETADKHYREWATAEVKRNILGKPVYSWAKENSEYGKSLDASLICIKRRTLDAVFDYMIQNGMFDNFDLGQQSIVAINDIIRSHGFEIACGLCYIDAKRYRAAMVAGQFADLYNDLVKSMLPDGMAIEEIGYFNYGKNSADIYQTKGPGLANIPSEQLNFDKIDEVLKTHKPKSKRSSGDVEYRVAKALKSDPSMRKLVSASDFMSKTGFENVGKENAALLKLYNAKKGTGGPKATEGDTQYLHEILASSSFDADKYFRVGGLRVQSFSDYIPRLVMDYAEMIGDMAAKKLPSHAYSKELMFALQFGLSGMKINMSLIPAMVKGGTAPGLDANGNYAWRDGQSFGSTVYGINKSQAEFLAKVLGEKVEGRLTAEQGFQLAKLIQSAEGYRENCGTIAIGVSNEQIFKMLEDEDIRMIIPYHRSGLNHILASLMNVKGFTDYTAQQNTLRWNGEAWVKLAKSQKDFNFNEYMYTHKCDARTAAQAYIQWCEKKGYKPKFSGYSAKSAEYDASADFTKSDNYYKVLEDFNSYDAVNGQALPQKAVQAVFPNDQSAFGSMKDLMAMAIDGEALQQARQDKTVPEIVKEILKTLPALEQAMREAGNDEEKIQAYEEWRGRNGYGEQMQYSERDYSTPSDEELLMNARVEDAANVEQGRELKDYQALGERIATLEKQLAEARLQTQLTNRALNTRGIGNVVKTVMKDYDITDARHTGTAKNATLALTDGYQKALDLLDKGASPAEVNDAVYNGAVKAAEIILEQGTYSQNLGGKWQVYSASRYLGESKQDLIDSFVSEAYADFVSNRYREARPETAADRLVAQTKKEAQERVDKYKGRSDALAEANRRLEEKKTQAETEAKEARKAAGELFLEIKDIRQELLDNKTMSEQERKAASKKLKSLNKSLEAKREEAASWQKRAKRNASLLKSALESKNRDISALNNRLSKEQAAALEKQKNLETKLEKQIQRERDILAGKLRAPELVKMLKAEREKAEARVKEQKEQVFQNYKERKKASDLRGRIKNLSDEMKRRMTNPTDRAYVPASLYQSMTKLADVLDNVLSPNPGTKAEARYRAMMDAIRGMAREYEDVKNLDPVFASEYEQEISDAIGEIERILERKNASWIDGLTGDTQKGLAELNSDELQQLYDLMRQINYTITNATKVFGNSNYKSIFDAQRAVADQQNSMKGLNMVSRLERKKRLRLLNSLSVMRATEMMAGWDRSAALYQLMHGIEQGADDAWAWVMDYNKSMQDLKTGKNEKEYRQALTKQLDFGITDRDGLKVTMTKMQALQILMTAEREEHNDKLLHLQAGGAVIRNATDLQNGKGAKARSQTISVTPELIQKISDSLTEWDRAYMKTVRDYFKREGKRTNEILYKLKHKVLKTEEFYVPYTVDRNYLEANLNEQQALNMWVKTPGSTNALKQKAKQPVIIDGMDTVMGQHVKEIGNYIGMAIPIRDFSKVYNGMIPTEGPNPLPVKETIERTFGKAGQHLLTQAVIDVQGGTARQNWESNISQFLNKLQGAFVKSALLINPSVTIKQAASYIAAESVISHLALERGNHPVWARTDESKSFMPGGLIAQLFARPEGKTAQRIYNEIDQYTSLHYQRRQGMSMAEIAEQANRTGPIKRRINAIGASMEQSKIGHAFRRTGENLNPITWIQRMDVATTAALWVACKEQAKLDKLAVGSEEFWKRTTELYERCIRETQPMYDGLHRTANQKQAGGLMQYLFPFRTVPIQNHGQLAASYEAYKAARESKNEAKIKEAGKFFRKTAWAQTESAFVFSAMTFLAAILKRKTKKYRDEEGEFDAGSFTKGLLTDVGSTLISVLNPMYGSELFNLGSRAVDKFEGNSGYTYDAFSVGVVDMINDLASSGDRLLADAGKIVRGENVNAADFWNHAMNLLLKGGKLAGIPADTVKTYFEGTKGNIQDAIEGRIPALNDESWERDAATNARRYMKAIQAGDTEKAEAVMEEMRENYKAEKPGLSEKAITRKVRNALASYIKEQYTSKEISEEDAISYLVDYTGKKENDAFWQIREWEAKKAHKGDAEYTFSPYEHLRELIDNGKDLTGEIAYLQEHGKTASAINSDIKKYIRQQFDGGELNEQEAMKMLQKYHKVKDDRTGKYRNDTEDEAWFILDEWKEGIENEDDEEFSYVKYRKLFSAMDNDDDASAAWEEMSEHGVSDDTLKKAVSAHLQKQFQAGEISEDVAIDRLQSYRGMDEDEAYWQVDKWKSSDAAYKAGEDFNESNYRDLYAAIDGNKDPAAAMKELTSHGYKESDVYTQAKKYLSEKLEKGEITEQAFKNKLSRYCKIVKADEVDDAVQSVKNSVRYKKLMESKPDLDATESQVNAWYDGTANTRNNGHESAKTAGMSIENYIKAKTILADVKDANGNRTGEDEYIVALTKITWLTPRQKDALYYERYKGTTKYSHKTW